MEGTITKAFAREHRCESVRRAAPDTAAPASAPLSQAEQKKPAAKKAAK